MGLRWRPAGAAICHSRPAEAASPLRFCLCSAGEKAAPTLVQNKGASGIFFLPCERAGKIQETSAVSRGFDLQVVP